jgi:hypothetical protein
LFHDDAAKRDIAKEKRAQRDSLVIEGKRKEP